MRRNRMPFRHVRAFRGIPDRTHVTLLDRDGEPTFQIKDCPIVQQSRSEQQFLIEIEATGKTFSLPVLYCRQRSLIPKSKMRLRDEDGVIWEIRTVTDTDDGLFHRCLCTQWLVDEEPKP